MLVFFDSGCAFVRGTAALPWKHNAAVGNAAATSTVPTYVLIRVFLPRCSIGPNAADITAAGRISVFDLVLTGAAWSRILTEYVASGLLTLSDGVGCRVLVPKALWPTYSCTEHNGAGWEGTILKFTGTTAVVRFSYAKTANGEPYENERLPLRSLRRL